MASSKINEHIILLGADANREAVLAALEEADITITHRVGRDVLIVNLDQAEAEVARRLPAGAKLLRNQDELPANLPKSDAIQLRAFRLRRTPKYRASKLKRPHDGREWGKGGLEEPDAPEDDVRSTVGLESMAFDAVQIPTNERLINDVAVGVVLVNGHGQYALSEDTKDHIIAEVQEGLTWLGNQEPDAKVSWVLDVKEATVDITPWQGARWPGMPESFFKGFDAAL